MTFIRLCPMTNTECLKKCHMVCIKAISEDDTYSGDIKVTYATKQDGTKEIVDAQSFHIPQDTQTALAEAQNKARLAIHAFFCRSNIGTYSLDFLVEKAQKLPECLVFIEGSQIREHIVKMMISQEFKFYIDRKQP